MASGTSDFGMKTLSTKDLSAHIATTIKFGGNIAIFGRRGSGKTEIAKQEIIKADNREVYLNASVFERVDMGGYPDFSATTQKRKYIDFLLPRYYEHLIEGDRDCTVLLDEVDKADPSVWAPLLEFTQFHTINGTKLPRLKAVIMTGNLQAEGGVRPCLPLLDRAEKYIVEASVKNWLDWASIKSSIHPSVSAYINDHQEDLFGNVDPGEVYADPSPRGWFNASQILFFGEKEKISANILTEKVAGCVGKAAGQKYEQYYMHYQVLLPLIQRVMEGEDVRKEFDKLEPSKQMVGSMITCSRFTRILDSKKDKDPLPKETKYVGKFLQMIDPEMALAALRSQISLKRVLEHSLTEDKTWDDVIKSFVKRLKDD